MNDRESFLRMAKFENEKASLGVALILLVLVGFLGVHRIYCGGTMLWIVIMPLILLITSIFWPINIIIWAVIEFFLIFGIVKNHNQRLIQRLLPEANSKQSTQINHG